MHRDPTLKMLFMTEADQMVRKYGIALVALSGLLSRDLSHEFGLYASQPTFAIRIVDEHADGRVLSPVAGEDRFQNARIGPPNPGARWIKRKGGVEGELAEAHVALRENGNYVVRFTLTKKGRAEFAALTRANLGHWLAILVDGQIVVAWLDGIVMTEGKGEIDDYYTEDEANALVAAMNRTIVK